MQRRWNVFPFVMTLHKYVSHAYKIAAGYNGIALGNNLWVISKPLLLIFSEYSEWVLCCFNRQVSDLVVGVELPISKSFDSDRGRDTKQVKVALVFKSIVGVYIGSR